MESNLSAIFPRLYSNELQYIDYLFVLMWVVFVALVSEKPDLTT